MTNAPKPSLLIIAVPLAALSAAAGFTAMAVLYGGFDQPPMSDDVLRWTLLGCIGAFVLSRLALMFPLSTISSRFGRLVLDFIFILGAAALWSLKPEKEQFLLELVALYAVGIIAWSFFHAGVNTLIHGVALGHGKRTAGSFFLGALTVAVFGSALLALPVSWQGVHPVNTDAPDYLVRRHALDAGFTAVAGLTNTGLSTLDVGYELSLFGQGVLLGLMQIGGIAILAIGAAAGWRLRTAMGWNARDDNLTPRGLRRLINFTIALMLLLQIAGTVALYPIFDAETDSNFAAVIERFDQLEPIVPFDLDLDLNIDVDIDRPRAFYAAFHSISAFNGCGLSLGRDALIPYGGLPRLYYVLWPLMILGSLGGPVLYELFRRFTFTSSAGLFAFSRDTIVTVIATAVLIAGGGAMIYFTEADREFQQRYMRDDTTRIELEEDNLLASAEHVDSAASQRLHTMSDEQRWYSAIQLANGARGPALRTVRLDEASLTPASRIVMMSLSFIGGGLGGTSGGLRIAMFCILIGGLTARVRIVQSTEDGSFVTQPHPAATAAALFTVILLLTGLTFLALTYRERPTVDACLFEAVNAVCNAGYSTGMTPLLTVQGKSIVAAAMFLGRVLPIAILLPYLSWPRHNTDAKAIVLGRIALDDESAIDRRNPVVAIPSPISERRATKW